MTEKRNAKKFFFFQEIQPKQQENHDKKKLHAKCVDAREKNFSFIICNVR